MRRFDKEGEGKVNDFQTPPWICNIMVAMIPEDIRSVLEPTPGEGNLVRALARYNVTAPADFWAIHGQWDCVVMNPPFSPMKVGYDILYRCMEMTNVIIALMPWLTIINSEKRTQDIVEWGLRSVTHLPRCAFPGARVQCCILEMQYGYVGDTALRFSEAI